MKTIYKTLIVAALSLPLQAMASNGASWTDWRINGVQDENSQVGVMAQNGLDITVEYTGSFKWNDFGAAGTHSPGNIFGSHPTSFSTATYQAPPDAFGTIAMDGTGDQDYGTGNFHFSHTVINPLIAVWSVGQPYYWKAVSFVFNTDKFDILAQGAGLWGDGTLVKTLNQDTGKYDTVSGFEGNGLIQFYGEFDEIAFKLPVAESYFGITVGAPAQVPLPAALPLMAAGLGLLLGFGNARRSRKSL